MRQYAFWMLLFFMMHGTNRCYQGVVSPLLMFMAFYSLIGCVSWGTAFQILADAKIWKSFILYKLWRAFILQFTFIYLLFFYYSVAHR